MEQKYSGILTQSHTHIDTLFGMESPFLYLRIFQWTSTDRFFSVECLDSMFGNIMESHILAGGLEMLGI